MSILVLYASGHPHEGQYPPQTEPRPERLEEGAYQNVQCPPEYQPPWTPIEHEIAIVRHRDTLHPERVWVPTTLDFQAEAARQASGGRPVGVASYDAFLNQIRVAGTARPLQRVLFFGHGADNELRFGSNSAISTGLIQSRPTTDLSSCFLPGGEIDLYCCNTGQDQQFLIVLAEKWRVNVAGTAGGIRWRMDYEGEIHQNPRITYRGVFRSGTWGPNPSDTSLPTLGVHASPSGLQSRAPAGSAAGFGRRRS